MSDIVNGILNKYGTSVNRAFHGFVLVSGVDAFMCTGVIRNGDVRVLIEAGDTNTYGVFKHGSDAIVYNKLARQSDVDTLNSKHIILSEIAGDTESVFVKNLCTALNLPNDLHTYTFSATWTNVGYVAGFVRRVKLSGGYNGIFKVSISDASGSKEYSFWSWDSVTFYADQIPTRAEINDTIKASGYNHTIATFFENDFSILRVTDPNGNFTNIVFYDNGKVEITRRVGNVWKPGAVLRPADT